MDPEDILDRKDLKMAINNLLWQYLPEDATLREAEKIATPIFEQVVAAWELSAARKRAAEY